MKKIIFFLIVLTSIQSKSYAQSNINSYTLVLQNDGSGATPMAVAYNPIKNLYYQATGGGSSVGFFTFGNNGNQVDRRSLNWDHRGLWWNTNTNQLEGNGFDSDGIVRYPLDGNGIPNADVIKILNFNTPLGGQGMGVYNPMSNEIIIGGYTYTFVLFSVIETFEVKKYNYTNGNSNGTIPINIPIGARFMTYSMGYTGVNGIELAFYDRNNQRVYYYDISGGNYVRYDQLPNDVPNSNGYDGTIANGYIFFYDNLNNKSLGYKLNLSSLSISSPIPSLTSCFGASSTPTTFNVTGSNLTASVTITAPSYFEISTSSGGTYSSSLTLTNTPTVSQTLYVRLNSSATAGDKTGNITATSTGASDVTTTVSGTVKALPTLSVSSIVLCAEATYLITKTTSMPVDNGWSVSGTITVNNGYVTAGTSAGSYTVSYTDGCAQTVSATVTVLDSNDPSLTGLAITDTKVAFKFNGSPQGPSAALTVNYIGYDGYTYFSQTRPTNVGFYNANIQSGTDAGCPNRFYIFTCATCNN
jgi:hypothetical protein